MSRPQAVVAWITFVLTLWLAPHIEQAVVLGILGGGIGSYLAGAETRH